MMGYMDLQEEQEFHHYFDTWEGYPRLNYFFCGFKDVLPRFKEIAGVLPECFDPSNLLENLDNLFKRFDGGLRVTVHGNKDLHPKDFLMFSEIEEAELTDKPLITMHIYRIDGRTIPMDQTENLVSSVFRNPLESDVTAQFLLLLKEDQLTLCRDKIANNENTALDFLELKRNISCRLESILVEPFLIINEFTQQFVPVCFSAFQEGETSVIGSDNLKQQILHLFGCRPIFEEIFLSRQGDNLSVDLTHEKTHKSSCKPKTPMTIDLEDEIEVDELRGIKQNKTPKETNSWKVNEETLKLLVNTVAMRVSCSSVDLFANRYSLRQWICHSFLTHIDFEEAIIKSIGKNTRKHLEKLAKDMESGEVPIKNSSFIYYRLIEEMENVFEEAEEMLSSFHLLSEILMKINFEVKGYLKQSIVPEAQELQTTPLFSGIAKSLREDLLGIAGIYGVGTFYGTLEIHIKTQDTKSQIKGADHAEGKSKSDSTSDGHKEPNGMTLPQIEKPSRSTSDVSSEESTETQIKNVLKKHGFAYPFSIKHVLKEPSLMCLIKPGDKIYSNNTDGDETTTRLTGTVGGFWEMCNELHGLTCGHVIGSSNEFHIDYKDTPTVVSHSLQVCEAYGGLDIAAFKLVSEFDTDCKGSLRSKKFSKVMMWTDCHQNLHNRPVFKFGGFSGFTKGVVVTEDYGRKLGEYLVLIAPSTKLRTDKTFTFRSLSKQSDSLRLDRNNADNKPPMPTDYTAKSPTSETNSAKGINKTITFASEKQADNCSRNTSTSNTNDSSTGRKESRCNSSDSSGLSVEEGSEMSNPEETEALDESFQTNSTKKINQLYSSSYDKIKIYNQNLSVINDTKDFASDKNSSGTINDLSPTLLVTGSVDSLNNEKDESDDVCCQNQHISSAERESLAAAQSKPKFEGTNIDFDRETTSLRRPVSPTNEYIYIRSEKSLSKNDIKTNSLSFCERSDNGAISTVSQESVEYIYVRSKESLSKNDIKTNSFTFCERGDSGAIVCLESLGSDFESYYALSMILGGELEVRDRVKVGVKGGVSSYSCSFKLCVGLEALKNNV